MTKNTSIYLLTFCGFLLFGIGVFLIKTIEDPTGIMRALPYACVGIGCVTFGQGIGNIINYKAIKSSPGAGKQLEIEWNDERNIAIENRTKAKAYDMMILVFEALIFAFALMGVDMAAIILLVLAFLFVMGYGVYYRIKYQKEM